MTTRIDSFITALDSVDRPEIWIDLVDPSLLHDNATRLAGPLSGLLLAVKNNVDVAGLPTTAGCPGFATGPATADAEVVRKLRAAGATVVGTTNLDQFATGLVGQRSPYGGVRDARRPDYVSGGSSSGSAVAVALGVADIAIGTDTAGSGRVPAALQGIVGIKPTLGVVSTRGVLPACPSWDAVTIMARDLDTADLAMGLMAGGEGTRPFPTDTPLAAPPRPRVAVPDALPGLSTEWAAAFEHVVERVCADDAATVERVPFGTFLDAARLLYDGGLVAERHASVGAFVDAHCERVDPVVGQIISRAGKVTASQMVSDLDWLEELRVQSMAVLAGFDGLLMPTVPGHPTVAAVAADPVGVNSWMGTYTNFTNLFDMCAVAVPAGTAEGAQFGVTVVGQAFHDAVALDIARRVYTPAGSVAAEGAADPRAAGLQWVEAAGAKCVDIFVVGAHLPGQPLEREMTSRGARFVGPVSTAAGYRLFALDTEPPKPGLVSTPEAASAIRGGVWRMSPAALGTFLDVLPAPMTLGPVNLADGRTVVGFGCNRSMVDGCRDITEFGGWLGYLSAEARSGAVSH